MKHVFVTSRAFTLIELLIVVAIIAILAAIAVPNFLEAQVRSKVSRVKSDLRSSVTAIESYYVDYQCYPVVGNPEFYGSWDMYTPLDKRLTSLTTPISYMSSLPHDPFYVPKTEPSPTEIDISPVYWYCPGNLYAGGAVGGETAVRKNLFSIASRGPDGIMSYAHYCVAHPYAQRPGGIAHYGHYDPTNGTISGGDIWMTGSGSQGSRNTLYVQ